MVLGLVAGLALAPRLDTALTARAVKPYRLLATTDTPLARLTATVRRGLINLHLGGAWDFSFPDPNSAERAVHPALAMHPKPRRVLLVGGCLAGLPAEVLKHPSVTRLDCVELDPGLIRFGRRVLPAAAWRALDDPRVRLHLADGRRFIRLARPGTYDVVLLNLADPQTAQVNRYYTREFYGLVWRALAPGGA